MWIKTAVRTRQNKNSGGEGLDAGPSNRNRQEAQRVDGNGIGVPTRRNGPHKTQDPEPEGSVVRPTAAPTDNNPEHEGRRRMKWDSETNKQVLRSFFTVTSIETDMTMYRTRMHQHFIQERPHLNHLSVQRIADQRRVILRNNLLPQPLVEQIKEEVRRTLGERGVETREETETVTPPRRISSVGETQRRTTITPPQNETNFNDTLCEFLALYRGTDPCSRPVLPKLQYKPETKKLLNTANKHTCDHLTPEMDLEEIHLYIYCIARTTIQLNNQTTNQRKNNMQKEKQEPGWKQRLTRKIDTIRKEIGRTEQFLKGQRSKRILKKLPKTFKEKVNKKSEEECKLITIDHLDTLKQKLAAYTKRNRRYQESYKRKCDNAQFEKNQRLFYRTLKNQNVTITDPPDKEQVKTFWEEIWATEAKSKTNATWIKAEEEDQKDTIMEQTDFTEKELSLVISNLPNWRAPGRDGIHNYWYKKLTYAHTYLVQRFNDILHNPQKLPSFLTNGITHLLAKSDQTQDPAQYRPITCLPTLYKILTSLISNKIYTYLESNDILTEEQKGCRRRYMGCKEQITIDSVILEQTREKGRNLNMAYVDYQKAFDSVPHDWLLKTLQIYNIDRNIINLLKHSMTKWNTKLKIAIGQTNVETDTIKIKRGIFQGDSLSALWFCLSLNPISKAIKRLGYGATIKSGKLKETISHLFFMDDLKIYTTNQKQLEMTLKLTHQWSTDIGMTFGVKKCQTVTILRGKLTEGVPMALDRNTVIQSMSSEPYKYLGILQTNRVEHKQIKEILTLEFQNRLNNILKTKLNSRNITTAINSYVLPALQYSFGVVKWTHTELEAINRKIRTSLTKHRMHHPKAALERITLPREKGGRGIKDAVMACKQQIMGLRNFFYTKNKTLHQIIVDADTGHTPLNLSSRDFIPLPTKTDEEKLQAWRAKELHGRYRYELEKENIDTKASVEWIKIGNLFPETEGFVFAIQDQTVKTRNYQKYILKEEIPNDRCRKCNRHQETTEHILSACPRLAETKYLERHNKVAAIVYLELLKQYEIKAENITPYYDYKPPPVIEKNNLKIYWDKAIITDKTTPHNRPDITVIDRTNKKAMLIDISIPNNNNVETKYNEKIEKYTQLKREIRDMWHLEEVKIIPVVLSSMGLIPKKLKGSINEIGIPWKTYRLMQKAVILDAANIVRSFLET